MIFIDDQKFTANVQEINTLSSSKPDHETFSVLLSVKSELIWEQGVYDMELSGEKLSVFMVPVNHVGQEVHYEIIFN